MLLPNIAFAQDATLGGSGGGSLIANLLPLILIIVVFYFLLIRPQNKRAKQHREMLAGLSVNDEVIAAGGLFGKIAEIGESAIKLDVGEGKVVRVQKQSVQALLPKGTLDKL